MEYNLDSEQPKQCKVFEPAPKEFTSGVGIYKSDLVFDSNPLSPPKLEFQLFSVTYLGKETILLSGHLPNNHQLATLQILDLYKNFGSPLVENASTSSSVISSLASKSTDPSSVIHSLPPSVLKSQLVHPSNEQTHQKPTLKELFNRVNMHGSKPSFPFHHFLLGCNANGKVQIQDQEGKPAFQHEFEVDNCKTGIVAEKFGECFGLVKKEDGDQARLHLIEKNDLTKYRQSIPIDDESKPGVLSEDCTMHAQKTKNGIRITDTRDAEFQEVIPLDGMEAGQIMFFDGASKVIVSAEGDPCQFQVMDALSGTKLMKDGIPRLKGCTNLVRSKKGSLLFLKNHPFMKDWMSVSEIRWDGSKTVLAEVGELWPKMPLIVHKLSMLESNVQKAILFEQLQWEETSLNRMFVIDLERSMISEPKELVNFPSKGIQLMSDGGFSIPINSGSTLFFDNYEPDHWTHQSYSIHFDKYCSNVFFLPKYGELLCVGLKSYLMRWNEERFTNSEELGPLPTLYYANSDEFSTDGKFLFMIHYDRFHGGVNRSGSLTVYDVESKMTVEQTCKFSHAQILRVLWPIHSCWMDSETNVYSDGSMIKVQRIGVGILASMNIGYVPSALQCANGFVITSSGEGVIRAWDIRFQYEIEIIPTHPSIDSSEIGDVTSESDESDDCELFALVPAENTFKAVFQESFNTTFPSLNKEFFSGLIQTSGSPMLSWVNYGRFGSLLTSVKIDGFTPLIIRSIGRVLDVSVSDNGRSAFYLIQLGSQTFVHYQKDFTSDPVPLNLNPTMFNPKILLSGAVISCNQRRIDNGHPKVRIIKSPLRPGIIQELGTVSNCDTGIVGQKNGECFGLVRKEDGHQSRLHLIQKNDLTKYRQSIPIDDESKPGVLSEDCTMHAQKTKNGIRVTDIKNGGITKEIQLDGMEPGQIMFFDDASKVIVSTKGNSCQFRIFRPSAKNFEDKLDIVGLSYLRDCRDFVTSSDGSVHFLSQNTEYSIVCSGSSCKIRFIRNIWNVHHSISVPNPSMDDIIVFQTDPLSTVATVIDINEGRILGDATMDIIGRGWDMEWVSDNQFKIHSGDVGAFKSTVYSFAYPQLLNDRPIGFNTAHPLLRDVHSFRRLPTDGNAIAFTNSLFYLMDWKTKKDTIQLLPLGTEIKKIEISADGETLFVHQQHLTNDTLKTISRFDMDSLSLIDKWDYSFDPVYWSRMHSCWMDRETNVYSNGTEIKVQKIGVGILGSMDMGYVPSALQCANGLIIATSLDGRIKGWTVQFINGADRGIVAANTKRILIQNRNWPSQTNQVQSLSFQSEGVRTVSIETDQAGSVPANTHQNMDVPVPTKQHRSESPKKPMAGIIGGIVAAVLLISVLISLLIWMRIKRARNNQSNADIEECERKESEELSSQSCSADAPISNDNDDVETP